MAFPISPLINDTYTVNSVAYVFNGVAWDIVPATLDPDIVKTDVTQTFTAPQRTSISAEDNAIDFTVNNNFTLTATAANLTVGSLVGCTGQSGVIVITSAENITGFGTEFVFKTVPTLDGVETLAYFVESETVIRIGKVA